MSGMTAALEIVGQLAVPDSVMQHRFAIEALGCTMVMKESYDEGDSQEQVVGTANSGKPELYGWAPNVAAHADRTGYVYLATINDGESSLCAFNTNDAKRGRLPISIRLTKGTVVRLNDYHIHWTFDYQPRVCIFVGSFKEPCDQEAITMLQAAVDTLARGNYYGAPRVGPGFRALLPDECLVPNAAFDACEPMLLADAKAKSEWIEPCAVCDKPAVCLDSAWPIFSEHNRCADHVFKS